MPVCYCGGVRTIEHVKRLVRLGVEKVAVNSAILDRPEFVQEMAEHSGVGVTIRASAVPLLPGALAHAERGVTFGGLERNWAHFVDGGRVTFAPAVPEAIRRLLLDPQTSGGLLIGVPAAHAAAWDRAVAGHEVIASRIGDAVAGRGVTIAE